MKAKKLIPLLSLVLFLGVGCQHARVKFVAAPAPPPEEPKECKPPVKNKKACDDALAKQKKELDAKAAAAATQSTQPGKQHIIPLKFYALGFYPKKIDINAKAYCSGPVSEIYQYSTWKDALLENVTFAIYTPKTLVITCAP